MDDMQMEWMRTLRHLEPQCGVCTKWKCSRKTLVWGVSVYTTSNCLPLLFTFLDVPASVLSMLLFGMLDAPPPSLQQSLTQCPILPQFLQVLTSVMLVACACFVLLFQNALGQWLRGNLSQKNTTQQVLNCPHSVQHLQPKCFGRQISPCKKGKNTYRTQQLPHIIALFPTVLRLPSNLHFLATRHRAWQHDTELAVLASSSSPASRPYFIVRLRLVLERLRQTALLSFEAFLWSSHTSSVFFFKKKNAREFIPITVSY